MRKDAVPAPPDPARTGGVDGDRVRRITGETPAPEVGTFRLGSEASDWVLRRYLLTRALGASIVRAVYWAGVVTLLLAVLIWLAGVEWLAVVIGLVAIIVLLIRIPLSDIQRRISGVDRMGSAGPRVEELVGQTRAGIRAELRRIGLPSAPWGGALIGLRLLRPFKRGETVARLAKFDISQVVPRSSLDELQMLLRNASAFRS